MLKQILFLLLCFNLFALEVSIQGAKENFQNYSILHIRNTDTFLCQDMKDDFDKTTQIACVFSKEPSAKFNTLQNDFFEITSQSKNKTFFLIIKPFYKMKLIPIIFDLQKDDTVFDAEASLSQHWMIIGYKEELPFIKHETSQEVGVNFPFTLAKDKLPYVGALDLKGNPIHIQKVQDVSDYIRIKNYYKDNKYALCLELIDEVMAEYPNSLFKSELLFYKIRVFAKQKDYDNVIESAKIYLREYSSDENVPEVLSLSAKAYSKIGLSTDADYFFDRLFSEHKDSEYCKWGYIYMGEMLEESGSASKALEFFEKALQETNDIDIAAYAAYKLARYKISYSNSKEAAKYIEKILNAKPVFFMDDLKDSKEMMYLFAEEKHFVIAADIAKVILENTTTSDDDYEVLLSKRGIWLSMSDKKEEALKSLNEYIKLYKYGTYEDEVKVAKDSLFFDNTDANLSTRLSEYDTLIETYMNDTIGNRAIYEKAKLLYENKMYSDVLGFKESILSLESEVYPDTDAIIKESAIGVMQRALKEKECQEVLNISADYNITLSNEWDEGIYECAMKGADFLLAKRIASENLKSKDLQQRKKWLYRYIKVDFATGNYSDIVEASKELIVLIQDSDDLEYRDVYRILFDTYQRLENPNKMLDAIVEIQRIYGASYLDIERYIAVMVIGNNLKDDNMVIKYAKEVDTIQKTSNSYTQSPFVEFTLYQAYINKENYKAALEIIKSLDARELDAEKRARQKYLLGTVLEKLWRDEEADAAYQAAIEAKPDSAWAKLAKSAKDI
ncbi:tetratricopeptide repeat protein [bacterium]|nr:tetratricopeptide repeat protein [bacterium]MBU1989735.1 tetratricopeptide repeat protein [bacterium]